MNSAEFRDRSFVEFEACGNCPDLNSGSAPGGWFSARGCLVNHASGYTHLSCLCEGFRCLERGQSRSLEINCIGSACAGVSKTYQHYLRAVAMTERRTAKSRAPCSEQNAPEIFSCRCTIRRPCPAWCSKPGLLRDDPATGFSNQCDADSITAETALDGVYVIRTRLPKEHSSGPARPSRETRD